MSSYAKKGRTVATPTNGFPTTWRKHTCHHTMISDACPIRDRIYAHKEYAASSDKHDLFARTKILELEKLFAFLNHVYGILWELYFNGRAPQLKRISFSSARLLRDRAPRYMSHTVQEDIAAEVQGFLYGVSGP